MQDIGGRDLRIGVCRLNEGILINNLLITIPLLSRQTQCVSPAHQYPAS